MIKKFFSSLLAVGLISAVPLAAMAELKIGVVDPVRVLEVAPQTETARGKLEKEFASRDRELVAAQKDLKGLEDRLTKDGAIMSEAERSRLERDIITKRREMKRDQEEFREDVNFRRNEEFGKIQRQIVEAIREVAAEKKYDLVFGEGVIYSSKAVDITDSIVQRLKSQAK